MTYPSTSAEAEWPTTPALWLDPAPHGILRLLDLRPDSGGDLPLSWAPGCSEDIEGRVTDSGLHIGLEEVTPNRNSPANGTWALILSPVHDRHAAVAVLVTAALPNSARVAVTEHGLVLPWDRTNTLRDGQADHLAQVYRALLDPDSWLPGLADYPVVLPGTREAAALYDLLRLAHPRIPTHADARDLSILNSVVGADDLVGWLASPLDLADIATLAASLPGPHDAVEWLQHLPADIAASWAQNGPYVPTERLAELAVLVDQGWQPPTLLRVLRDPDMRPAHLPWLADLSLPPLRVAQAIEAGLSEAEIDALPAETDVDWHALATLAALRRDVQAVAP